MSELQKAWARGKLGLFPDSFQELPEEDGFQADEVPGAPPEHGVDDDSSSASSASSTGTIVPSPRQYLFARPQGIPRTSRTLDPIPWTTFFERELHLHDVARGRTYHAYFTSPADKGPLFVMHHGAGSCGLSFATLATEVRKRLPSAGILSPDARYHGSTALVDATAAATAPPPMDMSLDALSADLVFVIQATQAQMGWAALPPLVLIGHSLGGAVVTHVASSTAAGGSGNPLGASTLGYIVLDVVEGSAMDALQSMLTYLSTRPSRFATLQAGIDWHVRSRTIRNSISARTSVPGLLVKSTTATAAGEDKSNNLDTDGVNEKTSVSTSASGPGSTSASSSSSSSSWRWRTDLAATEPFWQDWFVGLSKKFLAGKGGKMLLLAGTDRLDTELTIGQMQGKYALQVFPEAGHFIHEDLPEKTATAVVEFFRRNDRSTLVLPPKVSDLLKQGKKV